MARPLVIVGGGEHARVVADAARSREGAWDIVGFTDRASADATALSVEVAYLGDNDTLRDRLRNTPPQERPWLVLGIGDIASRRRVAATFPRSTRWATVVHGAATVSSRASLEPGAVVLAGAIVNPGAVVRGQAIVNTMAVVEHDVLVGRFVHLAPGVVVGGGATIGDGAFVGLGALVRDHVAVGRGVVVGMGAVVVDDIREGVVVLGVPARERRHEPGQPPP